MRTERGCSVTQHQVSARESACTHEKEALTTSRFVRVIYSSHFVSIKLGTVTPLRRCGLRVHERLDGPALAWRCYPHAPQRCPAQQALLLLHPRVCPLLDRVDHVSRLPAHPGTAALSQARFTSRTCTTRASGGGSAFTAASPLSVIAASFFGGRRSLTASSLNMLPQWYPPTTLI